MYNQFNKMYTPDMIPNEEGFKCIVIDSDHNEFECIVKKNGIGMHSLYKTENDEPCWMSLIAWRYIPS